MSTASEVFPGLLPQTAARFALDVREGLGRAGQKEIPSTYLYDEVGSALFDAITHLPEYGLTRADERLLQAHASEIAGRMPAPVMVVELGSGTGRKTRHILRALARGHKPLYYPIDVSPAALVSCRQDLSSVATVVTIENTYLEGLLQVTERRRAGQRILLLFLGSTIGNFHPAGALAFLASVRGALQPGDALLLGADLVKPEERMLVAYDDPAGVTSAFNLNLLARINRELGADFRLREFRHEARYCSQHRRIEMHLRTLKKQTVHVPAADLTVTLQAGETIWTESSHKFDRDQLASLAQQSGFAAERQWIDPEWPFAENLWRVPAHG